MATVKRDYYEVLGVARSVSGDELKAAYRKLAMRFHPDRNQGDPAAEQRFKEVGEAYSVLSDPEKRKRYDTFGHAGQQMPDFAGGFSFDSAFDLFDMFFGSGTGRRRGARSGPQRGSDLRMALDIELYDVVFGAKRTVDVQRAGTCGECRGSGAAPGTSAVTCTVCGGTGQLRRTAQSIFGQVVNVVACNHCHGDGQVIEHACPACKGRGSIDESKQLEVSIPPGVDDDIQVRISGEGEVGPRGGARGDLYIGFRVRPHPQLRRADLDLVYNLPVSISQAVLGDRITVPTIGEPAVVDLAPGTQHGRVIKLSGLGVPHVRTGRRGDQVCVVSVVIPTHLSAHERHLFEELGGRPGHPAEVKKGFFDTLKDAFRG